MKRTVDELKSIKILKARNGVAIIAVLSILLILTLLLPAMFSMGEIQLRESLKGIDKQRASYFARAITEMGVAAFKQSYTEIAEAQDGGYFPTSTDDPNYTGGTVRIKHLYDKVEPEFQKLYNTPGYSITSDEVYLFYKESENQFFYATAGSTEYDIYNSDAAYKLVGTGSCVITYDNTVTYYRVDGITQIPTKITDTLDEDGNVIKTAAQAYQEELNKLNNAITAGTASDDYNYSLSRVENQNVIFTSTATVNNKVQSRSCMVILPTYPSEEQWLYFDGIAGNVDSKTGLQEITEGCNQMNFNPQKATGRSLINYSEAGLDDDDYQAQALQIYSCLGNMVINGRGVKDDIYDDKGNTRNEASRKEVKNGINGAELILGVAPSLNTQPYNDPNWNVLRGINGFASKSGIQKDNFIACSATNAIEVDVPVNLMVNGLRAARRGDWAVLSMFPGEQHEENVSIYKVLMFQAPVIYFARNVDMMACFYTAPITRNDEARRMSSVTLMAPTTSPYTYFNVDRNKTVNAGMVYFAEDCYLWVINHGNNGSSYSENWYEFNQTVWKKDTDFVKVKIANAGDVFLFNNEIKITESASFIASVFGKAGTPTERTAGLSLTGYGIEVLYLNNYKKLSTDASLWWQIWTKTKNALFGYYLDIDSDNHTYVADDLHLLGNVYSDTKLEFPEIDNFYTVWES